MTKNILILDDDDLVRRSVHKILSKQGYETKLAANAEQAMLLVAENAFDLIISDIRMPGRNGVEAIKEIRNIFNAKGYKDIPIIFITGYAEVGDELSAESLGEVILKPFDLNRLIMTVKEYL